ncbi:MAG: cytochrome c oxidase assembly protein [Rickettsiales bacterium]|nr:cytochrome c oxidase assembly protein [Rickettsiales bacterium]
MPPLTRFFVRLGAAFVLIFLATQLFNRFCFSTHKCQPIYFSKYIPRIEGNQIFAVSIEATNHLKDLDFYAVNTRISTVSNRVNTVTFVAKNLSERKINFRPAFDVQPKDFKKYVKRISCLCAQEYSLAPGQVIKMQMEFSIDPKIEKEEDFADFSNEIGNEAVRILYLVK